MSVIRCNCALLMDVLEAFYYTDPMCARSWGAEPARRRAEREYAGGVELTYVMGGLAREFGPPAGLLREWLAVAEHSGMPVDPRLWLDAPPHGSFPACIAVIVAAEQGCAGAYLRRAREAVALQRRALDHASALIEIARDVPGLDVARFENGLGSHAVLETFGEQLARSRAGGEGGLPRLEVLSRDGQAAVVRGPALLDPQAWIDALRSAGARPAPGPPPSVPDALRQYGRLATPEIAALCDLPGPAAPATLWRLAGEWRVRPEHHLGGEIWTLA